MQAINACCKHLEIGLAAFWLLVHAAGGSVGKAGTRPMSCHSSGQQPVLACAGFLHPACASYLHFTCMQHSNPMPVTPSMHLTNKLTFEYAMLSKVFVSAHRRRELGAHMEWVHSSQQQGMLPKQPFLILVGAFVSKPHQLCMP